MPDQVGHDGRSGYDGGLGFGKPYEAPKQDYAPLFEEKPLPTQSQLLVVGGKYIVSKSASGLMLVHVRRARERVFFDRFVKALSANAHVTQAALIPVKVVVGVEGRLLIEEHADMLKQLGFDITPFGTDTVVVSGVPEGCSAQPGKAETLVRDLLLVLGDDTGGLPGVMEQAVAQKFALMASAEGDKISSALEGQRLLDALLQSDNPEYTAAGKRIIAILPEGELDKRF